MTEQTILKGLPSKSAKICINVEQKVNCWIKNNNNKKIHQFPPVSTICHFMASMGWITNVTFADGEISNLWFMLSKPGSK